jgi:prophage tail gpP-like protein
MLISQVEHSLGDGGELTSLRLVRPDAFTPEPTAIVKVPKAKQAAGGAYAALKNGAL